MISFTYLLVFCLVYATALEPVQENGNTPAPEVTGRELTNAGYVIRHGDELYRYPLVIQPLVRGVPASQRSEGQDSQVQTNEIENEEEDRRRPLFYFTTYEASDSSPARSLPTSRPYIEIRKKRDVDGVEVPESSKVGKLRRKRTYCRKCGGGGGGGYYVPVSYAAYPVYYGGGGGGKGCYTCGGGGGGGGGGSFSYSSSSAQSSSGSFGWGKK